MSSLKKNLETKLRLQPTSNLILSNLHFATLKTDSLLHIDGENENHRGSRWTRRLGTGRRRCRQTDIGLPGGHCTKQPPLRTRLRHFICGCQRFNHLGCICHFPNRGTWRHGNCKHIPHRKRNHLSALEGRVNRQAWSRWSCGGHFQGGFLRHHNDWSESGCWRGRGGTRLIEKGHNQ